MALLEVKNLEVYYGVICALKGISFEVNEGEIVSLIGANGAGKTTMMQSVVGLLPKKSGTVIFDGHDITKTPCHKIVGMGMTQVPEGRRIFQELSVYDNLVMGAYTVKDQQQFKEELEKIFNNIVQMKMGAEQDEEIKAEFIGKLMRYYYETFLPMDEIDKLSTLDNPPHPFIVIMGGAKVSDKAKKREVNKKEPTPPIDDTSLASDTNIKKTENVAHKQLYPFKYFSNHSILFISK